MIRRLLLAIDDSAASLAAPRVADELATALDARLRVVHVSANHVLDAALEAAGRPEARLRRTGSANLLLTRAAERAAAAGVVVDVVLLAGPVGAAILAAAKDWRADLVIVGRSASARSGEPYIGSQTQHVLEFADQPVLVIPAPG